MRINLRRGLLRLWVVLTVFWLAVAGLITYSTDTLGALGALRGFEVPGSSECEGVKSLVKSLPFLASKLLKLREGELKAGTELPAASEFVTRGVKNLSIGSLVAEALNFETDLQTLRGGVPPQQDHLEVVCHNRTVLIVEADRQLREKLATVFGLGLGPPLLLLLLGALVLWVLTGFRPTPRQQEKQQ